MRRTKIMLTAFLGICVLAFLVGCSSNGAETDTEPAEDMATDAAEETAAEPFETVERWQTVSASGTVEAVNKETREISLRDEAGNVVVFEVDEQVERFDEIEVGDKIVAEYFVSLAAEIRAPTPEEEATPFAILDVEAKAPPESAPAGGALSMIRAVVTVEGIDRPTQTVTVKGPLGNYLVVDVVDPTRLERLNIGDTAVMTYTEALAIGLEKMPAGE
jgi:hypothetical protein